MSNQKLLKRRMWAVSAIVILGCIVLLFPQIRQMVVSFIEQYIVQRELRDHAKWMHRLFSYSLRGILVIILFMFFFFTAPGIRLVERVLKKTRILLKEILVSIKTGLPEIDYKYFIKPILVMAGIYLLGIISIIRADFPYADDLQRMVIGWRGFFMWSRYVAEFLSILIHADKTLTDISPLPQLLAILFLAISSVILVYVLCDKKITVMGLVASIPLGLSLYFLGCLSWKFDAPYMALSVLASIIPFLFVKAKKTFFVSSILCLLIMCMSYQAASGVYILLTIILCFQDWNYKRNTGKEIISFAGVAAAAFCVSMLFFNFFLTRRLDTYASTDTLALTQLLPGIARNVMRYVKWIVADFSLTWKRLILLCCIGFIIQTAIASKQNKLLAFIASLFAVFSLFILSYGVYITLKRPLFEPRGLQGFGIFLAILNVCLASQRKIILNVPVFALNWAFFVFSFTYGNALADQKRYTAFRMTIVSRDIADLVSPNTTQDELSIQIVDTAGFSPSIKKNIAHRYPIINRLVPQYLDGGWYAYHYFQNHDLTIIQDSYLPDNYIDLTTLDLPVVVDSYYHTIKTDGEHILVILKNQ
ncbi:hypothetical protein FACS189494_03910 [Spirochaetia bacterium]|nr:hypothetical protein FACS189494_03910 [Spirochaetia bacterium]